jgi:membrane-bound metal-dependent hydrolase YbcI (DUF457 family)
MMGKSHIIVGGAGFLVIAPPLLKAAEIPLGPGEIACGAIVAAGASLLPDIDHPQASASRALGPVTGLISRLVRIIAGGHRVGTHSLLAILLVTLGALSLSHYGAQSLWAPAILTLLCVALVLRELMQGSREITTIITSVAVTLVLLSVSSSLAWLWIAIGIGYALHIAADMITREGVALLWPVSRRSFGLGLITTDSLPERMIAGVCVVAILVFGWSNALGPALRLQHPQAFERPTPAQAKTAPSSKDKPQTSPDKNRFFVGAARSGR